MAKDIETTTYIIKDVMERFARHEANELSFLLKHLLDVNDLIWEISALECLGTNADALHEVSDT